MRVPIWSPYLDESDLLMDGWEAIAPKPSVLKESGTAMSSGTFENGGVVDALEHETSSSVASGITESEGMAIDREAAEGDQSDVGINWSRKLHQHLANTRK